MAGKPKHPIGGRKMDLATQQIARRRQLRLAAARRCFRSPDLSSSRRCGRPTPPAPTPRPSAGAGYPGKLVGGQPVVGNDGIINSTTTSGFTSFTLNASPETFGLPQ